MKILLYSFDQHPNPYGVDTFLRVLRKGLRQRGHTVDFLCSSHVQFLPNPIRQQIDRYRQHVLQHFQDLPMAARSIEILKYANEQLVKHIDLSAYDVIHSNNGVSSFVANRYTPDVPLFGTVHGIYYLESQLNGWAGSEEVAEYFRVYDQHAVECPTLFQTVSYAMAEDLPQYDAGKHIVIHNSIDADQFHPTFQNQQTVRIACAGHLNHRKGYDLLLEALKLLQEQQVDGFEVEIFGDGPLREKLEGETIRSALPVRFRGMVPPEELHKQLPGFQLFVQPSRVEPFGLSVTEAMASGCAVVCTRIGGLKEQVIHEENGLLFELEDVEGLAMNLRRAILDGELRDRLRRRAVSSVRERFTVENMVDKFEQAYLQTIELHAKGAK